MKPESCYLLNKLILQEQNYVKDCIECVQKYGHILYIAQSVDDGFYTVGNVSEEEYVYRNKFTDKYFKMIKATKHKLEILLKHERLLIRGEWNINIRVQIYLNELF